MTFTFNFFFLCVGFRSQKQTQLKQIYKQAITGIPLSSYASPSSFLSSLSLPGGCPPVHCVVFNIRQLYIDLQKTLNIPEIEGLTELRMKEKEREKDREREEKEKRDAGGKDKDPENTSEDSGNQPTKKRSISVSGHGQGDLPVEETERVKGHGQGEAVPPLPMSHASDHVTYSAAFLAYSFLLPWGHDKQLDNIIRNELRLEPPDLCITFGLSG